HDPSLIDAAALASAVKLLLATETAVGGPYRTWLVSADSQPIWLDVDVAVNSNVAYFLSLNGNRLPKLNEAMEAAIANGTFSSPYYPTPYAFVYYFARSYDGPLKPRLLRIARQLQRRVTTDLDRALCLSARLRLDDRQSLVDEVDALLAGQRRDGSWPAAVFYADPVKDGMPYYNGGPELTTAFVLEALSLYNQTAAAPAASGTTGHVNNLRAAVLALAARRERGLPAEVRITTSRLLQKVAQSDSGPEIIGLPQRVNSSLRQPLPPASRNFLKNLSLANLYGWVAYTIYDGFLDEEGQPQLLPAANVALRRSLDGFSDALPDQATFHQHVRQVFDLIDNANAWEQAHCRFDCQDDQLLIRKLPDYGDLSRLAERSLGHTLPAVAVLAAAGTAPDDPATIQVIEALRHYLIVRQLNDDLHDWPEDLQHGHITPTVAALLQTLKVPLGPTPLSALIAEARPRFWHDTLPQLCRLMRRHLRLSRQALRRSGLLTPQNELVTLLDRLDASIDDTLAQRRQATQFLQQYRRQAERKV
ncbi:MAG TPA: hypothetical protein VHA37_02730, partial [Candidatus Saccharimonadales bacterium]|nr:hypothetical protein [Candidatus Saccharimonadales bacterium]